MRKTRLLISVLLLASLSGCTPGDDHENVTFLQESEPNDGQDQADTLGEPGVYAFSGACGMNESEDWFRGTTAGGIVEASLHVSTEPPVACEECEEVEQPSTPAIASLAVRSANLSILAEAGEVTPSSPAEITGPAAQGGTIYVEIGCPGDRILYYSGLVVVP